MVGITVIEGYISFVQLRSFHLMALCRLPYSQFYEEFGDFILDLVTHSDAILIIGDFNIHLNKAFIWHFLTLSLHMDLLTAVVTPLT